MIRQRRAIRHMRVGVGAGVGVRVEPRNLAHIAAHSSVGISVNVQMRACLSQCLQAPGYAVLRFLQANNTCCWPCMQDHEAGMLVYAARSHHAERTAYATRTMSSKQDYAGAVHTPAAIPATAPMLSSVSTSSMLDVAV